MAKRITQLPNATSPTETDYLGMDNTSNGARKILVSALAEYILNHAEISDIGDVSLSNLTNGQVIKWNATTEKWENADESGGGGGSGNVDDVYVNGVSVLDSQHIAQIKSYKEVTQAEYDALPSSKLTDGIMYCITDSDFSASDVPYDNTDSGLSSDNTQGAIDELASNLLIQKSIENTDIATFTDGSNLPMPSLKVGIEPQQDLHGYDSPWVGGVGKNKLDYDTNLALYKVGENSFSGDSVAIASEKYYFPQELVGKTVTFSAYIDLSGLSVLNRYKVYALINNVGNTGNDINVGTKGYSSVTVVPTSTDDYVSFTYGSGRDTIKLKDLQIEINSERTAWQPYSNICPISGHTEGNVVVSSTTDEEDGTTYNIQFKDGDNPLTVYGGSLDVVSGELVVDRGILTLNGSEDYYTIQSSSVDGNTVLRVATGQACKQNEKQKSNYGTFDNYAWQILDSRANTFVLGQEGNLYLQLTSSTASTVAEFKALFASNPLQVVYELATPITYQLTPTQVKSLLGSNNVWCDTGKILKLEYLANATDVIASLDARITALENA